MCLLLAKEQELMNKIQIIYKELGGVYDVEKLQSKKIERKMSLKQMESRRSGKMQTAAWNRRVSQFFEADRQQELHNFDLLVEEVSVQDV
jgi:hypothetical protein